MPWHRWDLTVDEAIAVQRELAAQVRTTNDFDPDALRTVAGIDASYRDEGKASVVVLSYPDLTVVEEATATARAEFPYVPGLLSFRESPLALDALAKLSALPDLLMLDGQGIAHPRRFGIACHLGVLLDRPTIGVAKSVLTGKYEEPGEEPGSVSPLTYRGEVLGMAVRAKKRTNPLIVSVGHRIDLETAVRLVLACVRGYRLPETTRRAHNLAGGRSQRA
ncbi:MAG: deoxyribonuclease V [Capsulimonadales bacterium]|nr:deoxyribonuclease V [Capsulimonadales bacterium]